MAPPRPCQTLVGGTWAQSRRRAQPGPGRGAAPGPRSGSGSSLSRPLPRSGGAGGPPHRTAAAGAVPTASDEGFVTRRAWPTVVLRATPVRAPHFSPGRAAGVCGLPGASGTLSPPVAGLWQRRLTSVWTIVDHVRTATEQHSRHRQPLPARVCFLSRLQSTDQNTARATPGAGPCP